VDFDGDVDLDGVVTVDAAHGDAERADHLAWAAESTMSKASTSTSQFTSRSTTTSAWRPRPFFGGG